MVPALLQDVACCVLINVAFVTGNAWMRFVLLAPPYVLATARFATAQVFCSSPVRVAHPRFNLVPDTPEPVPTLITMWSIIIGLGAMGFVQYVTVAYFPPPKTVAADTCILDAAKHSIALNSEVNLSERDLPFFLNNAGLLELNVYVGALVTMFYTSFQVSPEVFWVLGKPPSFTRKNRGF